MFHEHVESWAMQSARLRRVGLIAAQRETAQNSGAGIRTPPHRDSASDALANGAKTAPGWLTEKGTSAVHSNGVFARVGPPKPDVHQLIGTARSPKKHVFAYSSADGKLHPVNGVTSARASPSRHVDVSPKPADAWSGACDGPGHDVAPAASPAAVTFAGFPSCSAAEEGPTQQTQGSDGQKAQKDAHVLTSRSDVHANGKVVDRCPAMLGTGGAVQVAVAVHARKRSREDCVGQAGQGAQPAGASHDAGDAGRARPATASVLWLPHGSRVELGDGSVQHSPLRAMHVAVLCQWSVGCGGDSGVIDVRWVDPSSESVVAAARALHRLSFLHWCHWGFAMQAHRTFIWGGSSPGAALPRVAHWPIHCALAARACRLAQQVST